MECAEVIPKYDVPLKSYFTYYLLTLLSAANYTQQGLYISDVDQTSDHINLFNQPSSQIQYLNIICRENSTPSVEFSIYPVLIYLPSNADNITFSKGQLPEEERKSFLVTEIKRIFPFKFILVKLLLNVFLKLIHNSRVKITEVKKVWKNVCCIQLHILSRTVIVKAFSNTPQTVFFFQSRLLSYFAV